MKTNTSIFTGLATLAGATLLLAASVNAGEPAGAMISEGSSVANLIDPITGDVSVGYDSDYMFRGYNLGEEAPWAGVELYVPLAMPAGDYTLTLGAWYINPTDGPPNTGLGSRGLLDDELDLYASLSTTMGIFDVELIYYYYALGPEATGPLNNIGVGDQNEVGLLLGTTIGRFDLGLEYSYNFDAGEQGFPAGGIPILGDLDHYFEPSIGTSFVLCDYASLVLDARAGWYSDQFSHLEYRASLPMQVTETLVFEPYAAYLDDRSSGTLRANKGPFTADDFFFGAALSVSF